MIQFKIFSFEFLCFLFFASHIPITLFVDGQALLPSFFYSWGASDMLKWYVSWSLDPLMGKPTLWFKSIIFFELTLQVPFFFWALKVLLLPTSEKEPKLFRPIAIAYGSHTATTLIPILATFLFQKNLTDFHKYQLVLIYIPYLLVPLAICWRGCISETIFTRSLLSKTSSTPHVDKKSSIQTIKRRNSKKE